MKERSDIIRFPCSLLAISARRVYNTFRNPQDHFNSEDPVLNLMSSVDVCVHKVRLQDKLLKKLFNIYFQYYFERLHVYIKNISDPYNAYLLLSFSISSLIFAQAQQYLTLHQQNPVNALKISIKTFYDELNIYPGPGFSIEESDKHEQLLRNIREVLESKNKQDALEYMYIIPHFMPNELVYLQALSKSGLSTLI